jgi:hypothetical protein
MKKLLVVGLLIAICIVVSPVLAATIKTDKLDYSPGETVILSGTEFTAGNPVYINVTRPGNLPGPYSVKPYPVIPDSLGAFTATYQLNGIQGTYIVDAIDSAGLKAQTKFDDCVPQVPEFPSIALPMGMIIGIVGLVYVVRKREI